MVTFIEVAVAVCVGSLIMCMFSKELTQLVSKTFDIPLTPLNVSDSKLIQTIGRISRSLAEAFPFMVYIFAILILFLGVLASLVDFLLNRFSISIIGLADATLFSTKYGKLSGASAIAAFIVLSQWLIGFWEKSRKAYLKQHSESNMKTKKRISCFMLVFTGIVVVSATFTFFRVIEMGANTSVPVAGIFKGIPTELLAFMASFLTILTAVTIYWASSSLEVGIDGIKFLVMILVIAILSILRGMTWICHKLLDGVKVVLLCLMDLFSSIGKTMTKSFRSFRKNKHSISGLVISSLIALSVFISGCDINSDCPDTTEVVIILDTSASFSHLLAKAIEKFKGIIDSLPPNSELTAIKIDANSYRQCGELVHLNIPFQTERQKYSQSAKAGYDKAVNGIKQSAIDDLQKALTEKSSSHTDVWGAVSYSVTLFHDSTAKKMLIVMSDLLDNVGIEPDSCDFNGIEVWMLFVTHADSPSEYKYRIAQYENYFVRRGALSVKFLDPIVSSLVNVRELLQLEE